MSSLAKFTTALALVGLSACAATSRASGDGRAMADQDRAAPGSPPSPTQISGVWVFLHRPFDAHDQELPIMHTDALMVGQANIVDDCLYVDDTVVVWNAEDYNYLTNIIDQLHSGASVPLRVGGAGISLDEGARLADFPPALLERCPTRSLWSVNPPSPSATTPTTRHS